MEISGLIKKAGDHPIETGLIVFGVGLAGLWAFGFFGSGSSDNGAGAQAYFGAVAAQGISGDQLQATQIAADASTQQAQISADAYSHYVSTFADVYEHQADVSLQEAQLGLQAVGLNALASVAATPPNVVTKTSNGFFGIGGGSSQKIVANPAAQSAVSSLSDFVTGLLGNH